MYKLPPHLPEYRDEFISAVRNRKETHEYPSIVPENMEGKISKISFICGCHGSIIASLNTNETNIPKNGKYKETRTGPISDIQDVPKYNNKVVYKTNKPIAEFEYFTIDVREMNVTLSTTSTCFGIPTYNHKSSIYKQEVVNEIMDNVFSTCPKNMIYKTYHKSADISHRDYETRRRESAARKIQEFVKHKESTDRESAARKIQRFMTRRRRSPKTVFMNYEKEGVNWLVDKRFAVDTQLVAVIEEPIPPRGEVDIEPTDTDAHKLVMIITKYTASGCESTKYVILASDVEMEESKDNLYPEFPMAVEFLRENLKRKKGDLIFGRKHGYPLLTVTLHDLIRLGKIIIEEFNGTGYFRTTPIDIYDLSCNTFGPFRGKAELNEIESEQVQMMDRYIRKKDVAYGGRKSQ